MRYLDKTNVRTILLLSTNYVKLRRVSKGNSTRQRIVGKAIETASLSGIEALTIGALAHDLDMSKSGLFAHFGSREQLQLATVDEIIEQFRHDVVEPGLMKPPGLARLRALVENWMAWSIAPKRPGGCPLAGAAFEFDSQPGEVRERIAGSFADWRRLLTATIEAGKRHDIPEAWNADALVFEIFGLYFSHHLHRWLLGRDDSAMLAQTQFDRIFAIQSATPANSG